jgi:hypothetical protein
MENVLGLVALACGIIVAPGKLRHLLFGVKVFVL